MGERKVLNKYYPPDFDPLKLPRGKRRETNEMKVRMMLPMSVRCTTCGTFMYKGTKFNTRKEDVMGENYLGIQVYRFYWRCKKCSAEFTMKTDPKNADYVLEQGATRNYEPWRDEDATKAEAVAKREEEEMGNAMKALENRTLDSKREMDIMAALDEMKALKSQHARVTTEQALQALQKAAEAQDLDEDDAADVAAFYQLRAAAAATTRRIDDDVSSSASDGSDDADGAGAGAGRRGAGGSSAGPSGSGAAGDAEAGRKPAAGSAVGAAAAGLQDLAALQQEAKGPAAKPMPPPAPKPGIKVMVKAKPKAAAPAAGAGAGPGSAAAGAAKRPAEAAGGEEGSKRAKAEEPAGQGAGGLTGLLGTYGSSGSDTD